MKKLNLSNPRFWKQSLLNLLFGGILSTLCLAVGLIFLRPQIQNLRAANLKAYANMLETPCAENSDKLLPRMKETFSVLNFKAWVVNSEGVIVSGSDSSPLPLPWHAIPRPAGDSVLWHASALPIAHSVGSLKLSSGNFLIFEYSCRSSVTRLVAQFLLVQIGLILLGMAVFSNRRELRSEGR